MLVCGAHIEQFQTAPNGAHPSEELTQD